MKSTAKGALDFSLPDRGLRQRSARGGAVTVAGQGLRFAIQLGSTAILARLLDQSDFGLVAMVGALTGFVGPFLDAGLSSATVQRAQLTHQQVTNLFWINTGLGVAVMGVIAAASPAIAAFYGHSELIGIAIASSVVFGLIGMAIQHQALLKRSMRFRALAIIDVLSMLAGVLTAIALARAGAGYWALVAQSIASSSTRVMSNWIASGWRPGLPRRGGGAGELLRFGWNVTGFNAVNYLSRNADNALIGWMWGAAPLGLYTKAYGLLLLPVNQINGPIGSVAVPALASLRSSPERYRRFYQSAMEVAVMAGMPVVALLFVLTPEVVEIVLGRKWMDTVPIFRALAPAALVQTTNFATGWIFLSWGHVHRQFRVGTVASIVTVTAFAAGLPWGPVGVAAAYSIATALMKVPALWYCYQGTPIRLADFFLAIWRAALASFAAATVTLVVGNEVALVQDASSWMRLIWLSLVFGIVYFAVLMTLPGGLARLLELGSAFRRPPSPGDPAQTR